MTLQEAYNKGLDDAELAIVAKLTEILKNKRSTETFPNPKLDAVRQVIKVRSDYYHNLANRNNNIGKSFKKRILDENEILDNNN